jgi:peptide chain release factor subunit 1
MITEEQVRRILGLRGDGIPILSLYAQVPPGPPGSRELRSRVDSLVSEIRPLTSDESVDRNARLSVRADIERIEEFVAEQRNWRPGTLALFCCSARDIFEEIELPRAVRDRIVLDSTPWVRSLLAVLDEYQRMCVVFIERGEMTLWELYQDELREVVSRGGRTLRARHVPAPNEERAWHKAEELTKRHLRDTIETIDRLFRTDGFDVLAIGGQEHERAQFIDQLPRHLRERIVGTFTLDKHPTETAHIRERAMEILEEHVHERQRRQVDEVLETVAAGGRAALGLTDCLWAGALAAIDVLLVEDDVVIPGVLCDYCGWMSEEGTECARCGRTVRQVADILDELAETVINEGGSVTHVKVPTDLSKHLVGALLRFELPPPPESADRSVE